MWQVPTQGIVYWVDRWSFVSLGEDGVEEALLKGNLLS